MRNTVLLTVGVLAGGGVLLNLAASTEPATLSGVLAENTGLSGSGVRVLEVGASFDASCKNCPRCGGITSYHQNLTTVPLWMGYGATHLECIAPYYCEGGHPTCSGGALVQPLVESILAADGSEVARLLREHSDIAYLNRDRQSVQVLGCGGSLDANIPLTAEQYEALSVVVGD